MAYGGYPINYPQMNYPQMQQIQQSYPSNYSQLQQMPQQQSQLQSPQIQNGGFMLIPSEDMARTYPVAPGNCVTFKIEGKPIVMEKSMGFSQLEAPRIDRYRLVREEDAPNEQNLAQNEPKIDKPNNNPIDAIKDEIRDIWNEINKLKDQAEDKEGA